MVTEPDAKVGTGSTSLELRLLGPMSLVADGSPVCLPRSKKTRALLAFLAMAEKPQRRSHLCALLWDMTDDPRGALRWSLSRLRKVLRDDADRIAANHSEVSLSPVGMVIDAKELASFQRQDLGGLNTEALETAATLYRGEFLEGLELTDSLDFSAWCIDQREQTRKRQCDLLSELVDRFRDVPDRALPYARQRVQVDLFDLTAQQELLQLLFDLGNFAEARQRFDHAQRLLAQVSVADGMALELSWRVMRDRYMPSRPVSEEVAPAAPENSPTVPSTTGEPQIPFVGRQDTLDQLESLLNAARHSGRIELALISGEPGVGKSRLAERLADLASAAGFVSVAGRAFEAESSRPFGPWTDALAVDLQQAVVRDAAATRDDLFESLRTRLFRLAGQGQGLLLVLDDLQWFDRNSTELLHYVVRTYDQGPMVVLMLARDGELSDNEAAVRLLRGFRRDHVLTEIGLRPLSAEDIAALIGRRTDLDARRVHEMSGGNPLYALELARAHRDGLEGTPNTLLELVRERITRLPDHVADVLRWGAVLGHAMSLDRLEDLVARPMDELIEGLERLEQSSLLRVDTTHGRERYVFVHDLIREAVYSELSQPRRRLMHRKVALALESDISNPSIAAELAHHAGLAGEARLGVRACIAAGHHALRVFANSDAEALARRGLRVAEELEEKDRIEENLNLLHVLYSARTPDREAAAVTVRDLAERALDLGLTQAARQGFQMLSYLRWEGSSLADAHDNILQAERVSRMADGRDRAVALAQAARCLVLLERNLQQAEAFVIEAETVARREGKTSAAVAYAQGMIAAHRGQNGAAIELLQEARDLARQNGEHLVNFGTIEHMTMIELDRGEHARGMALAEELVDLGGRVRPGAEVHVARALLSLADFLNGGTEEVALSKAVDAVRKADAKYELCYLLTRWAERVLSDNRLDTARELASEALDVAKAMGRNSEAATALLVLAAVAERQKAAAELEGFNQMLAELSTRDLSARSRESLDRR